MAPQKTSVVMRAPSLQQNRTRNLHVQQTHHPFADPGGLRDGEGAGPRQRGGTGRGNLGRKRVCCALHKGGTHTDAHTHTHTHTPAYVFDFPGTRPRPPFCPFTLDPACLYAFLSLYACLVLI